MLYQKVMGPACWGRAALLWEQTHNNDIKWRKYVHQLV